MLNHKAYLKQFKLKLLKFWTEDIIISPDPAVVRLKGPENLLNFKTSILVERKASCRFLNTVNRQILTRACFLISERSRVMACSSVTILMFHSTRFEHFKNAI